MAEGWDECEGKCKHWYYCDWKFWCGDCKTCPAYSTKHCSGVGDDRCYLSTLYRLSFTVRGTKQDNRD